MLTMEELTELKDALQYAFRQTQAVVQERKDELQVSAEDREKLIQACQQQGRSAQEQERHLNAQEAEAASARKRHLKEVSEFAPGLATTALALLQVNRELRRLSRNR